MNHQDLSRVERSESLYEE